MTRQQYMHLCPRAEVLLCYNQEKGILQHEAAWLQNGVLQGNVRLPCKQLLSALLPQ